MPQQHHKALGIAGSKQPGNGYNCKQKRLTETTEKLIFSYYKRCIGLRKGNA